MQKYAKINAGDKVVDALLALNDTHETLVSQNSGAAFPTTNLVVGMKCFRTDQNKTYTMKAVSPAAWVLTEDLNKDIYDADTFGGKKPADYAHSTGDGNMHVPATGTNNNGKVLMAGSTAGSFSWQNLPAGYSHPTTDGSLHVPATGTTNKGKVLKAGATAGSFSWEDVSAADIKDLLTTTSLVPVGTIITFPAASIPSGYLKCNGAAVGRTTYPQLFACISTTYGAGDGSTTFNLPDLRGEFIRGLDDGRGVDSGRVLGSRQEDALQSFRLSNTYRNAEGSKGVTEVYRTEPGVTYNTNGVSSPGDNIISRGSITGTYKPIVPINANIANETRPRNIAMTYIIKY